MALLSRIEDAVVDEELNALFKELVDQDCEKTTEEYIDFDVETCSSMLQSWRVSSVQKYMAEYLSKESGKDVIEVVSSHGVGSDIDVEKAKVEAGVHEIMTWEALALLDKLINLKKLNKDERAPLSSIKDRLDIIRVKSQNQHCTKNKVFH